MLRIPEAAESASHEPARGLREIARQPTFLVAVSVAALGYAVMNLLMTATPLAMSFCGHPYGAAAGVIAAHVVGMFAPSFVTGSLIARFGVVRVIQAFRREHANYRRFAAINDEYRQANMQTVTAAAILRRLRIRPSFVRSFATRASV